MHAACNHAQYLTDRLASRGVFVGRRVRAAVGVTSLSNRNGIDHLNYPSKVANKDRPRNVPWRSQRGQSLHGTLRGPWPP